MDHFMRKTGLFATSLIILLTLIFIIAIILFPPADYTTTEAYLSHFKISGIIPVIPSFLLVLANIPLFAALYFYADNTKRVFGLAGILFGTGYMVCSGINYYLQLSMVIRNISLNEVETTKMFLMNNPASFSYAADNLGYTFLSLAFLAFSGIFNRSGLNSWVKTFSILFGVSGLLGSVGFIINNSLLENMVLISALPYLICISLIFIEFKRIRPAD
ncbi:MAG: hypothetical protein R6W78_05820 [Bacteroidales bacterium]